MTRKDRITAAFRNEKPDRVPVSPELWDAIPFRVSGRPFHEFGGTSFGKTPLWRAQLDAYRYFDCEAWVPVEPGPSARQKGMVESASVFVDERTIRTDVVTRTSRGDLRETRLSTPDYDLWSQDPPVKDPPEDLPKLEEYFFDDPSSLDYSTIERAFEATGDSGICEGVAGNGFFEFLALNRAGGAVQAILDLCGHTESGPGFFAALRDRYAAHLAGVAEEICRRTSVEGIFLNCGSSTLSIVGPDFFRTWDIPVVRAVARVARRHGRVFHYHLHGRGRPFLDDLVRSGVGMICPLEPPPKGDFDLAEVKRSFGGRLALKGGFDPFHLRQGTPESIGKRVAECIDAAAGGGGYTLATGDGVLVDTPFENIRELVKRAREYGVY
jgi:hypothetical protein